MEIAKTLNDFFSNIVKKLEILECKSEDDHQNRLSSKPVLQVKIRYRNHPSFNTICRFLQRNSSFYFLTSR